MDASVAIECMDHASGPVVLAPAHLAVEARELENDLREQNAFFCSVVFATSGTSGLSKWVILTKDALKASATAVNRHLNVTKEDRILNWLPEYHVGGFGNILRAKLVKTKLVTIRQNWNEGMFTELCKAKDITISSLVPTQVYDLVKSGYRAPMSLRAIIVGGGAMSVDLKQAARDLGWPVLQSYGMTEAGSQIATEPLSGLVEERHLQFLPIWRRRVSSEGVLEIGGAALFSGYAIRGQNGFRIEKPFKGAWFTTQDFVQIDCDHIVSVSRADQNVKVLGELVDVAWLEKELNQGLLEQGIYVVPREDARRGKKLIPFVEDATLESRCLNWNQKAPGFMRLESVSVVPSLPRNGLGKVERKKLE